MMKEVESGKVGTILIKDMSRMGRDYLKVGPYQIARALKEDKVEIPAVHMAKKDAGLWKGRVEEIKDPYGWGSSTVAGILKKREYLGHTVNFKTRKHFKDKKSHYVSEDTFTKKIGQTVYIVRYYFYEEAKKTMQEKINRMLVTEASRQEI